ncbi:MAG TPA: hypothetical protein VH764_07305 [Gemmatimonadales bacterium]|jgi:hypothetical protein
MRIDLGFGPALVLVGALAIGGTSTARAQDSSQASSDTAGYQNYGPGDTSAAAARPTGQADSAAAGYTGPATDTTLKAVPGVQTGPAADDTGTAAKPSGTAADSVVCKDGSNAARTDGCMSNGGIDWASTEAAMKARGESTAGWSSSSGAPADTVRMPADSTRSR